MLEAKQRYDIEDGVLRCTTVGQQRFYMKRDEKAYRSAVEKMLAVLNDPVARTVGPEPGMDAKGPGKYPEARRLEGGVLLITIGDYRDLRTAWDASTEDGSALRGRRSRRRMCPGRNPPNRRFRRGITPA